MGLPTNNYGLQQPTVGGEVGTWGTNLNNNTIAPLDAILGNTFGVTITSADVNITNTQFQNAVFKSSGALTGPHTLFLPVGSSGAVSGSTQFAVGGKFVVENNTTGSFLLTVNSTLPGAVGTVVPQGGRSELYSDGTNIKTVSFGDLSGCFATTVNGSPQGQLAGQAGSSAVGMNTQIAYDATNNALYACATTGTSATAQWNQPTVTIARGFDTAINLGLSATHDANNILTVNVLTSSGGTPTVINPVSIEFASTNTATGTPTAVNVTGALSVATSSAGATFGSQNNTSFRLWILAFNNGGTAALALTNCVSSGLNVSNLDETTVASPTAMSTSANVAGTIYCSSGTSISSKTYRILGYLTYENTTLVTAGSYTADPDVVRIFGPGIKKPGDHIKTINAADTTATVVSTGANTQKRTNTTASIAPISKANVINVRACGNTQAAGNATTVLYAQLSRGTGPTLFGGQAVANVAGSGVSIAAFPAAIEGFDFPQTTVSQSYSVYVVSNSNSNAPTAQWGGTVGNSTSSISTITLTEIMG